MLWHAQTLGLCASCQVQMQLFKNAAPSSSAKQGFPNSISREENSELPVSLSRDPKEDDARITFSERSLTYHCWSLPANCNQLCSKDNLSMEARKQWHSSVHIRAKDAPWNMAWWNPQAEGCTFYPNHFEVGLGKTLASNCGDPLPISLDQVWPNFQI